MVTNNTKTSKSLTHYLVIAILYRVTRWHHGSSLYTQQLGEFIAVLRASEIAYLFIT